MNRKSAYSLASFCLAFIVNFLQREAVAEMDCISGTSFLYAGERSYTSQGIECQRWDTNTPNTVKHVPADGGNHNFCRNPDKDIKGTWCYTTNPNVRWGYCNIPKCATDAVIIWTSYDGKTNNSFFSEVAADPEAMSQKYLDKKGKAKETYIGFMKESHYKALDTNYEKNLLYFTDVRENYFGMFNMKTESIHRFLHGMAQDIEAISYDWCTGNFYWTDSKMNWVMVSDSALQSYLPIYRTDPSTPYAIEVHSVKRLLIFSTYLRKNSEMIDAKIISADLSGQNQKVLFSYPDVVKVVALTIDYAEDRIYWIDFVGYGSKVSSSFLDGTGKVQQYNLDQSSFFDLAVFSDYIYVSDTRERLDFFENIQYHIHIITKRSDQVAKYTVREQPFGIARYSKNDLYSSTKRSCSSGRPGQCVGSCHGICLPRTKGKRQCACSLGYSLVPKTNKCVANVIDDEYMLVVDAGRVYQIPFNSKSDFSIVPFASLSRISAVEVDPSTAHAYVFDEKSKTMFKRPLSAGSAKELTKSYAREIEIDPLTGNILFIGVNGKTIAISTPDGSAQRMIVKPASRSSEIKMIALDIKNKFLYWTDTFSSEGDGKLLRCRFDGSGKQVILDKLHKPHGITIDLETKRLFILESKKAIVYEIPLEKLEKIKTPLVQSRIKKHNLLKEISHRKFLLTELKVHEGIAYVADERNPRILKFHLGRGPSSLSGFGPSIFYKASSLSLYSKNTYNKFIKSLPNPCSGQTCRSICVELSEEKAKCLTK